MEIDIEVTDEVVPCEEKKQSHSEDIKLDDLQNVTNAKSVQAQNSCDIENTTSNVNEAKTPTPKSSTEIVNLSNLDESVARELKSMEEPRCEVIMDPNHITELEKVIHNEFFEGRPTKTALRYLKVTPFLFLVIKINSLIWELFVMSIVCCR